MRKTCLLLCFLSAASCLFAKPRQAGLKQHDPGYESKMSGEGLLVALRHSIRPDGTRVVLEFNNDITYTTEFSGKVFRVRISGCRNLVPTGRSNPEGRDIKKMIINSGPKRSGLVLTFDLKDGKGAPMAEVIKNPCRLIISVPSGKEDAVSVLPPVKAVTHAEPVIPVKPVIIPDKPTKNEFVSGSSIPPRTAVETVSNDNLVGSVPAVENNSAAVVDSVKNSSVVTVEATATAMVGNKDTEQGLNALPPAVAVPTESVSKESLSEQNLPPEINIDVEPAYLAKEKFYGRTVAIDVGCGGRDHGVFVEGKPYEKNINLSVALKLKKALEAVGLRAVLNRTGDTELTREERTSFANKMGGDLYISLRTGGSSDPAKHGIACIYYDPLGYHADMRAQGACFDAVYNEWIKTARFDLAMFLATKINERLISHLKCSSRGVSALPVNQLKFIVNPAVLVEIGMLTDQVDGKNLMSEKYHDSIAKSIANAVVDFFNGIVER